MSGSSEHTQRPKKNQEEEKLQFKWLTDNKFKLGPEKHPTDSIEKMKKKKNNCGTYKTDYSNIYKTWKKKMHFYSG